MENCIFCKIVSGELPAKIYQETDNVLAIENIEKLAPVHVLIIPKKHIQSMNHLKDEQGEIVADLFLTARNVARKLNIDKDGYKLLIRTGKHGEQEIPHIHLHLIGGAQLSEVIRPIEG